jgi:thiamine-phosphate pyrophosphorylase
MTAPLPRPLISAITSRRLLSKRDGEACERLVEWSAAVARAGVDILQIRERGLDDASLARLVRNVLAAAAGSRVKVLVNDRTDIALATGAAGVHLPSSAFPAAAVRLIAPDGFLVGRSVHAGDDLAALERAGGCDYLTFGTVFPSTSKPADHRTAGVEELRRACAATSLPVLAIGGVTVPLAAEAARAGAAGVAAIGLFLDGWRPESCPDGTNDGRAARLADTVTALRTTFTMNHSRRLT